MDELILESTTSEPAPTTPQYRPLTQQDLRSPRRRRILLPVALFVTTCFACFWAGATQWDPTLYFDSVASMRQAFAQHWGQGVVYAACVLAILLTHEMGHFLATIRYRIPATLPFFLPLPISPLGTLGAVIGMDGLRANRKEMFDIGIAGPLAGLAVAFPILLIGIYQLDPNQATSGRFLLDCPWIVRWLLMLVHGNAYASGTFISSGQLNPFFMAGWVGMLITGINMLPVGQLDGGHVLYTLFPKKAHWIARGFLFFAIAFVVFGEAHIWVVMLLLVISMGTDHPPTADDSVSLGWVRTTIGCVSLTIPFLCFPPAGIIPLG